MIKNPDGGSVPPKTLAEAGTMAVAYSIAWEAKVVAGAWWVNNDQVSKTAPTGEYLTTGSFMIRGKKNYLPPCQLIMGLSFLFRLEDSSIERHKNERRVRIIDEESEKSESIIEIDKEIELEGNSDDDECLENTEQLDTIKEEVYIESDTLPKESENKDDSASEGDTDFPDVKIKIDYSTLRVELHDENNHLDKKNEEEEISYLGDKRAMVINSNKGKTTQLNQKLLPNKPSGKEGKQGEQNQLKRGQKSRLKKIKEKYKDQDEEDRHLAMEVLQSAGAAKEDKRRSRHKDPSGPKKQGKKKGVVQPPVIQNINTDHLDEEDTGPLPEIDMLDQLTGKPVTEDELLFAVPVVAPYSTLLNYKFKVKLTPGTGKRGKAAKTAIAVFLRDKEITSREKDLLKAVKDETVGRNIPGKVKISAPQIQKIKNK